MIYLGMDVHKYSITIAVLPQAAKAPTRLERLANDLPKLKKWLDRVAREGGGRCDGTYPDACANRGRPVSARQSTDARSTWIIAIP